MNDGDNFLRGCFWGCVFEAILLGFTALAVFAVLCVVGG